MTYRSSATPLIVLVAFILVFGLVFALLIYGGALGWILIGLLLICVFVANRVIRKRQIEKENELARHTQTHATYNIERTNQTSRTKIVLTAQSFAPSKVTAISIFPKKTKGRIDKKTQAEKT